MSVEIEGVAEMQRTLGRIAENVSKQASAALGSRAEAILSRSNELVPVDTGELRDSGIVVAPERRGDTLEAGVAYTAPHAAIAHYELSAPLNGQRHFLSNASFQEFTAQEIAKGIDLKKAAR